MALTARQIAIVKSTAPVVKEHGKTVTTLFYNNMLDANPDMRNVFSLRAQHTGAQPAALAASVFAYAANIDNLGALGHAVERIVQKHVSLYIQPHQYAIVGKHLLEAFASVLGPAWTDEVRDAWIAAYGQLADIFIGRERQIYDESGPEWQKWRRFVIARREKEADDIVSFYLRPTDGVPLRAFRPGQYVSVQVPLPGLDGLLQSRQYSISQAPRNGMEELRISVKRDGDVDAAAAPREDVAAGRVPGVVCQRLHDDYAAGDEVEVSAPCGEFYWDSAAAAAKPAAPLVLLSAGVGATPIVSILDAVLGSEQGRRPVSYVHGSRSSAAAPFRAHVRAAAAAHANVRPLFFVKTCVPGDEPGDAYDLEGRIDLARAADHLHLADADAEYYMCGPEGWMLATRAWLAERGVAPERLHLELFNTGDV